MPSATSQHLELPKRMVTALRAAEGDSHMADDVTPLGMLVRYWNLEVPTPDGTAPVMVNSYKCRTPAFGGTVSEEKIKDAFIGVSKKKIIDEAGGGTPTSMLSWVKLRRKPSRGCSRSSTSIATHLS